jgi:8-oxo-dGTP diphosphatase
VLATWAVKKGVFERLPKGAFVIMKEAARHILRRPVVGVAACALTPGGQWVLIRRGDTGTWALPGGTLEWGETLTSCLERELKEEAGICKVSVRGVVGVYSDPERDLRFHGVTVCVLCDVAAPEMPPVNPLEILEVRAFDEADLPQALALGQTDMLDHARKSRSSMVPANFE